MVADCHITLEYEVYHSRTTNHQLQTGYDVQKYTRQKNVNFILCAIATKIKVNQIQKDTDTVYFMTYCFSEELHLFVCLL